MAYTITEARPEKMSSKTSGSDKVQVDWSKSYFVDVTGVDPLSVSALDILSATDSTSGFKIPTPNKSAWYDGTNGSPYLICRSVSPQRDPNRKDRWRVDVRYDGQFPSTPTPQALPDSVTDISPNVRFSVGEINRVMYFDKADQLPGNTLGDDDDKQAIISPSGSWYEDPTMERIATQEVEISQYESFVTYDQLTERRFSINAGPYRGKLPYTWLIEDCQGEEVTVQLAGGPFTAALVTYKILNRPWDPSKGLYGWMEDRVLLDTHYKDKVTGKRREFFDSDLGLGQFGYITKDGEKRDRQTGTPDSVQFVKYDIRNFNLWMQI